MRKLLFITATHGNEKDGTKVMQRLEQELPKEEYGYDWIIANERAYAMNVRFTENDLNRSAPGDLLSPVYELRRAAEIIEMSKNFDWVIDLHGTKTDSGIVTIVPYPTRQNLALASACGLKRVVIWYSENSKYVGPLVQHMSVPALEFECGPRGTDTAFELTYTAVRRLIEANRAGKEVSTEGGVELYEVYGKLFGEYDATMQDFQLTYRDGESFYPFLSGNEYSDITCYKMNKVDTKAVESNMFATI